MKKLIILLLAACLLAGCCPVGEGADMAKYSYNGVVLPALPDYDKEAYPYAFIHLSTEIDESLGSGKLAYLVVADKQAYLDPTVYEDSPTTYSYTLGLTYVDEYDESKIIYAKKYVIALDDASAESSSATYPGLNTSAWTEMAWDMEPWGIPEGSYYALAAGNGPIWANVALYTEDGDLFIEGSEPVRVFDLKSFLTGLTLGLAGKPVLLGGQKTPVAYLYNGVRLPALPEWDRESYPYAYIDDHSTHFHTLRCFAALPTVSDGLVVKSGGIQYVCPHSDVGDNTKWTLQSSSGSNILYPVEWNWTNFDLSDSDGNVLFTASDPIPVYE